MISSVYSVSAADAERVLSDPSFFAEFTRYDNESTAYIGLEKSWQGLHYLLNADPWEATGPAAFLIFGGAEVPESDNGYGPTRFFSPAETTGINMAIASVSDEELWRRFNAEDMTAQNVYPMIWDEPAAELKDEFLFHFNELKKLIANAADAHDGLLVDLV